MGGISVDNSQTSAVGFVPIDLAADLNTLDNFEDFLSKTRPDLAAQTDAFTDRLRNNVVSAKPIDVTAAAGATQDLLALLEKHGLTDKIAANASFDDLRDPHNGLASLVDDPAAKRQIDHALDRLDAALGGDAKLEDKAADLIIAGANGVQGKDAHGADMQGKDAHGADKQGMRVEDTMLGLTAQDLLSMPLDIQKQLLSRLSLNDLLVVANALKDKLDHLTQDDSPVDMQQLKDLHMMANAVKDEIMKSAAVDSGGMMDASDSGDGDMMDAGASGSVGRDIITDGVVDDAVQDRKGDADVQGSGDARGGGRGGKATIRSVAAALGRAIDDAYTALQAKADALGDDPSPSDAIDLQADSAVASALYKAVVEVINALGKNINDGVRTRQ